MFYIGIVILIIIQNYDYSFSFYIIRKKYYFSVSVVDKDDSGYTTFPFYYCICHFIIYRDTPYFNNLIGSYFNSLIDIHCSFLETAYLDVQLLLIF